MLVNSKALYFFVYNLIFRGNHELFVYKIVLVKLPPTLKIIEPNFNNVEWT